MVILVKLVVMYEGDGGGGGVSKVDEISKKCCRENVR